MSDKIIIQEKIIEIINMSIEDPEFNLDELEVDLSTVGMDSIKFIRIVVALEEAFDIEIPDEYLLIEEMNTIEKMIRVVLSALTNAESRL